MFGPASLLLLLLASTSFAGTPARPDLAVTAVAPPAASITPGASVTAGATTKNVGQKRSPKSTTLFYLSRDRKKGKGDIRLAGKRLVKALKPKGSVRGTTRVKVPATVTPGSYFVLACADALKKVKEATEKNNCKASKKSLTVRAPTGPATQRCRRGACRRPR